MNPISEQSTNPVTSDFKSENPIASISENMQCRLLNCSLSAPTSTQASGCVISNKRKRRPAGTPDPEAVVVALSPKTLMESERYVCDICGQGFQREQNLQMHRRRHKVPWKLLKLSSTDTCKRVYICPELTCLHHDSHHALGDLVGIKKHYRRKHCTLKQWKCQKCSRAYAVQSDYKAHIKTCGSHGHCCDCGLVFSRVETFIEHQDSCTVTTHKDKTITTLKCNKAANSIKNAPVRGEMNNCASPTSGTSAIMINGETNGSSTQKSTSQSSPRGMGNWQGDTSMAETGAIRELQLLPASSKEYSNSIDDRDATFVDEGEEIINHSAQNNFFAKVKNNTRSHTVETCEDGGLAKSSKEGSSGITEQLKRIDDDNSSSMQKLRLDNNRHVPVHHPHDLVMNTVGGINFTAEANRSLWFPGWSDSHSEMQKQEHQHLQQHQQRSQPSTFLPAALPIPQKQQEQQTSLQPQFIIPIQLQITCPCCSHKFHILQPSNGSLVSPFLFFPLSKSYKSAANINASLLN